MVRPKLEIYQKFPQSRIYLFQVLLQVSKTVPQRQVSMYSNGGYGSTNPEITNNPFINDPTNAQSRFPDLSATVQSPVSQGAPTGQYTSWPPGGYQPQPGSMYPVQQGYPQQQQQQPYDGGGGGGGGGGGYVIAGSGYLSPGLGQLQPQPTYKQPFQPSSAFGQQLVGQVNGSGYGYLQGQAQGGPKPESLSAPQHQIRNNPGYIAQFDPYASIGQGWDGQNQQGQGQSQSQSQLLSVSPTRSSFSSPISTSTPTSTSTNPTSSNPTSSNPHPRDYLRSHKAELESWDTYAWKQLFNCFDALKDAWVSQSQLLRGQSTQMQAQMQYGGYYAAQMQQELGRLQTVSAVPKWHPLVYSWVLLTNLPFVFGFWQLLKDADSNAGSLVSTPSHPIRHHQY